MEMPLDLTWARERILKIIDALGRKAKLSIFSEFYVGRHCVGPYAPKILVGVAIWVFNLTIKLLPKFTRDTASLQIRR